MHRVLECARKCWKVGAAPIDCKAPQVSGGPSSFSLPIFMIFLNGIILLQPQLHTPCLHLHPWSLSLATHLWAQGVLVHFFWKRGFGNSISHTPLGYWLNRCGYLVNPATYSPSLLWMQKHCKEQRQWTTKWSEKTAKEEQRVKETHHSLEAFGAKLSAIPQKGSRVKLPGMALNLKTRQAPSCSHSKCGIGYTWSSLFMSQNLS